MSRPQQTDLLCPRCGRQNTVTLWESVNVTVDPELKDQFLQGALTSFECVDCGALVGLEANLLYHDMDQQLLLWLCPADDQDSGPTPEPVAMHLLDGLGTEYLRRLVASRARLGEKILLFDAGLDDRVVEVLKVAILGRVASTPPPEDRFVFAEVRDPQSEDAQLTFTLITDEGDWPAYFVPLSYYHALARELTPHFRVGARGMPGWAQVNRAFAIQFASRVTRAGW